MSDIEIKLEPQDEYNHEPDEASNYNESMYFNVFDHNKKMGGWFRLGNRPNEGYAEMIAWAKDNLSSEEKDAYNRVVNGRDLDATKMAVQGLQARMSNTAEPNLVRGKQSSTTDKYESMAQVTAAMSDPRYEKDPAYRKEVEQKIARSDVY